jgi:hypothetical protein
MSWGTRAILAGLTATALVPFPRSVNAATDDAKLCGVETARQERLAAIPDHLLHAISLVESGRWDADHRVRIAWPWTVTSEGDGRFLPDKRSAIDLVRRLQSKGVSNIDVGCMQVNLRAHPAAFRDLDRQCRLCRLVSAPSARRDGQLDDGCRLLPFANAAPRRCLRNQGCRTMERRATAWRRSAAGS